MDIPVLKYVDILIGLSLVMVLVSTIVLAITQTLLNSTFARARHLQRGLRRLILGVEPTLMRPHTRYLSALIVRHPLIGQQTILNVVRQRIDDARAKYAKQKNKDVEPLPPISPGSVVQREELAYLMIEFAAGEGPLMDPADKGETPKRVTDIRDALAQALRSTGVEDPAATLRAIRFKVLENERANPDQPSARWRADAVMECATSDFIGKLHASFDNTIARVSDGFTAESKLWVSAVALLCAIGLQLDSFALLKRLSIDDAYRDSFVKVAEALEQQKAAIASDTHLAQNEKNDQIADTNRREAEARESLALLGSPTISLLPRTVQPGPWGLPGVYLPDVDQVPGVLLSWVLLTLGAPFWFDALKNLLKLRSLLAKKDDAEREQRDTAQPPIPRNAPPGATGSATDTVGEAGDLTATGALG